MFKRMNVNGIQTVDADAVAALSLAHAVAGAGAGGAIPPDAPASRWHSWVSEMDWTPDLAVDIGSRQWWRGMATLSLLCTAAYFAWPGLRPIPVTTPALAAADWEEARALTITPLAWGADTGRKMAATDAVQPLAEAPERPRIELTATLGQGDSFTRVLERSGVSSGEAGRIAAMVSDAIPLGSIAAGTRLDLVLGRRMVRSEPRPVESLAFRAALDLRLEFVREANVLRMDRIRIAVDDTPLRIRARVGSSLYLAARDAGVPPGIIQSYLRIIGGQLSLTRDVAADDLFDMVIAHRRAETGEEEFGDLLYAGLIHNDRPRLRMLPWTVDGREQWFEASGVGQQRAGLAMPTNGRITSGYGMRRHPILGYTRMHRGIDFGAPYGAPVYAVTDGRVNHAGYKGGFGQFVGLDHSGGMGTGYGHLSRVVVHSGQFVRRGQVIGYVGSSGLSTGPHLHYEMYRDGVAINPAGVRFTTQATLSGAQLSAFRARLAQLTAIEPGARRPATATSPATAIRNGGAAGQRTPPPTSAASTTAAPTNPAPTRR